MDKKEHIPMPTAPPVADHAQQSAGIHRRALSGADGSNGAAAGRHDLVFHLHGLQDEEDVALLHEPLLLLPIAFGMLITNLPGAEMYHEILFAGGHVNWEIFGGQPITQEFMNHLGELGVSEAVQGTVSVGQTISVGLLDVLYLGVKLGIYPCLIFMGVERDRQQQQGLELLHDRQVQQDEGDDHHDQDLPVPRGCASATARP